MEIAELPQPNHKIIVKVLMAQRTDIDRFAEPKLCMVIAGRPE